MSLECRSTAFVSTARHKELSLSGVGIARTTSYRVQGLELEMVVDGFTQQAENRGRGEWG